MDSCNVTEAGMSALTEAVLRATSVGTSLVWGVRHGLPYLVTRGPMSLTAYIHVPKRFASYDDAQDFVSVHGGLTFGERTKSGTMLGWDYAHCDDGFMMPPGLPGPRSFNNKPVILPWKARQDCFSAIQDYQRAFPKSRFKSPLAAMREIVTDLREKHDPEPFDF
jgi:hypothetical protein